MTWFRNSLKTFLAPKRNLFEILIVCMVLFSAPAYSLDSYTDDMTSTTGWEINVGTGTATQVTFDGRSCFKLYVPTAGNPSGYANVSRILPVSGSVLSIKLSTYFKLIGTSAAVNYLSCSFRGSSDTANMTT